MICPYCGTAALDARGFCLSCGAPSVDLHAGAGKSAILPRFDEPSIDRIYEVGDSPDSEWREYSREVRLSDTQPARPFGPRFHRIDDHDRDTPPPPSAATISPLIPPNGTPDRTAVFPAWGEEPTSTGTVRRTVPPFHAPVHGTSPAGYSEVEMAASALGDGYEIVRKIGAGGMAGVFLARERELDRLVAVKVLSPAFLADEEMVRRFRREAKIAARLEHPNIISIHRVGDNGESCWFSMNYIEGGTLASRLKECGALSVDETVRRGADICAALAYAHSRGVIHRDLKPDNILIDRNDRSVVTDFGIASAAGGTRLTRTGAVLGTPQFMSPDQACGYPPDPRSDLYSLGVMLYRMATGSLPFDASDPLTVLYLHVHKPPVHPRDMNRDVPEWLSDIIRVCLEKKPADRFSSAEEVRDALLAIRPDTSLRSRILGRRIPGSHAFRRALDTAARFFAGPEGKKPLSSLLAVRKTAPQR